MRRQSSKTKLCWSDTRRILPRTKSKRSGARTKSTEGAEQRVDASDKTPPTEYSKVVCGYRIGTLLGSGGFAKVYVGTHVDTGEKVALKILNSDLSTSTVQRQLTMEFEGMFNLNHPNIARLLAMDMNASYQRRNGSRRRAPLLVTELCQEGCLYNWLLETGRFEQELARTFFLQLLSGLRECHRSNVAHRDLKPDNILLSETFQVKIADFGLSASQTDRYMTSSCVGTTGFMAPEIFQARRERCHYDAKKVDIWACGVILFMLLFGFPPYMKPKPSDWWFARLLDGDATRFWMAHDRTLVLDPIAKDIVARMLDVTFETRPTVDELLAHPFCQLPALPQKEVARQMRARKPSQWSQNEVIPEEAPAQLDRRVTRSASTSPSEETAPPADVLPEGNPHHPTFRVHIESDHSSGFGRSGYALGGEPVEVLPQPYTDTVKCFTQFVSRKTAAQVITLATPLLSRLPGASISSEEEVYSLTVTLSSPRVLVFYMQVFSHAEEWREDEDDEAEDEGENDSSPNVVVVFRRLQGDAAAFRSLFLRLRERLAD